VGVRERLDRLEEALHEAALRQAAAELAGREDVSFDEALDGLRRWWELQRRHPPIRRPDGRWDMEPTIRGYHEEQGLRGAELCEAVRDFCLKIAERLDGGIQVDIRPADYAEAGREMGAARGGPG
jgi:hypothetical protein